VKTRLQKNEEVEALREEFARAPNALVVGFQGIKVADDERLRRELRQAKLTYRVVKNTLAKRAAEGTPIGQVRDSFAGSTAIALSPDDPVTLAKVLSKWAKESSAFTFKAGVVEGSVIQVKDIEAISNLPSKEDLISKMMFLINSSAQRIASVSGAVARNLAVVLDQVRAQREGQGA